MCKLRIKIVFGVATALGVPIKVRETDLGCSGGTDHLAATATESRNAVVTGGTSVGSSRQSERWQAINYASRLPCTSKADDLIREAEKIERYLSGAYRSEPS